MFHLFAIILRMTSVYFDLTLFTRVMKTFDQSKKSQKTVASMIIDRKKDENEKKPAKGKENKGKYDKNLRK